MTPPPEKISQEIYQPELDIASKKLKSTQVRIDPVRYMTPAPTYDIDPRLALSVMLVESNLSINAKSPKGAQGVMQLIPQTAERFNVKRPFDSKDNIRGGLSYLRWLLAYYHGRMSWCWPGTTPAKKAVDRYRGIPPYPETREYVKKS